MTMRVVPDTAYERPSGRVHDLVQFRDFARVQRVDMNNCPQCRSDAIHRSRTRSRWEELRKELTGKRPYRCDECGWRGWVVDLGPRFSQDEIKVAQRAVAPKPPNLKHTEFSREKKARGDVDLRRLDSRAPLSAYDPDDDTDN